MSTTLQSVKDKVNTSTTWFLKGLDDWLYFLQGPQPAVFKRPPRFEKKRLFRLLVFAVGSAGILGLITTVSFNGIRETPQAIATTSTPAIILLLCAGTIAGIYSLSAKLFRIPITVTQAFYIFGFLSLPWLPSTALVLALENVFMPKTILNPSGLGMVLVVGFIIDAWLTLTIVVVLIYVFLGIYRVSGCSAWRCWASVFFPVILFVTLLIWLVSGINLVPAK